MPTPLRTPAARGWRLIERLVERQHTLFLANYAYQARFHRRHAVVPNAVTVQVIGEAGDAKSRTLLRKAHASGDLTWWGYLPSDEAFTKVAGSLAGLCLLRDLSNFQLSMTTKIAE